MFFVSYLQMLGTFILWFGWYGFNSGSALIAPSQERGKLVALSAVNTTLSGGMAGLVALFVNLFILERQLGEPIFDLKMAMNGSLSGLVAITAGCGVGTFFPCNGISERSQESVVDLFNY